MEFCSFEISSPAAAAAAGKRIFSTLGSGIQSRDIFSSKMLDPNPQRLGLTVPTANDYFRY